MAQVHLAPKKLSMWLLVLAAGSAGLLALVWWFPGQDQDNTEPSAAVSVVDVVATPSGDDVQAQTAAMLSNQNDAAKEIERHPSMKPIEGPIRRRPPFVSEMEWLMLKGAVEQHPTPEQELTRLVNLLRFTKQLELWEGLANSADLAQRKVLAEQLLDDLPRRLINGEMELKDVQRQQTALLRDAVQDTQERIKRAAIEAKRLVLPETGVPAR